MINKSDLSPCRSLTCPAIRPCESVSPSNLINSLINLAHAISDYKSRLFATNMRNARNSIRLVGNLLVFLGEIRKVGVDRCSSVVLSLSELHFIFQKVQKLLEDCTREGSRLWTLMKSQKVSNQYRDFMRSIALALDVLPLQSMDVPVEVEELVDFVKKQALQSKFEVESDDRRALEKVHFILNQFEGGLLPEDSDLRCVLEYLGIQSWGQCNKEVKFLEGEIGLEWLASEKRDLGLLSSLMGFMIFCRCKLFDVVSNRGSGQSGGVCNCEVLRFLNPDDFRCPISLEIMTDPGTISTGHTYDRSSILKWFKSGNPTCPKTGEKLICTDLVPNVTIKRLIDQYCLENGIPVTESGRQNRDITRTVVPGSLAAEGAMKMLASFLVCRLVSGTCAEKNKAAYEMRLLTKTSIFNRSCLVEAGAIQHLLSLLSSKYSWIQENAIAALLNLSKYSKSIRVIVENGGLELMLDVLKEGLKMEARQHAAGTFFYLASVEEYRKKIGEIPEAVLALVELLREGTYGGKKNALAAILGLLMYPNNHRQALEAGLVPLLIHLLKSSEMEDLVKDSLAILANLAEKLDGTIAILHAGGIPIVVEVFTSSASRVAKEYCTSVLLALCINSRVDVVRVLVKNQSLMVQLYSQLTEGTSRASRRANTLIRIMHEFNEKLSSELISPAISQEQFIHVQ